MTVNDIAASFLALNDVPSVFTISNFTVCKPFDNDDNVYDVSVSSFCTKNILSKEILIFFPAEFVAANCNAKEFIVTTVLFADGVVIVNVGWFVAVHVPALHVCPDVQTLPHEPQLLLSFCKFTQALLHTLNPDEQEIPPQFCPFCIFVPDGTLQLFAVHEQPSASVHVIVHEVRIVAMLSVFPPPVCIGPPQS